LYAFLYVLLPSPQAVFVVIHLVNYLLVGMIAWLIYSIATEHLKLTWHTAGTVSIHLRRLHRRAATPQQHVRRHDGSPDGDARSA
jgi:hypothetical protein